MLNYINTKIKRIKVYIFVFKFSFNRLLKRIKDELKNIESYRIQLFRRIAEL